MGTKSDYIAKINKIPTISFNKEQKEIAKKIIENTDEKDLDAVYGLITQRVKTGFVFDEAPEVNHNCVALIKEDKKLNITGDGFEPVEHKLIIGENYDALKNLCATYIDKSGKGLIDVIYIDPPYNTEATKQEGNDYKEEIEATKFIYRDKFTRDGWLNMMNERLKLAKRLLSEKGVIFISIDDSEQAYLKVLCDEIFGENNFIANIVWKCKNSLYYTEPLISIQTEFILAYAKKKSSFSLSTFDKENINGDDEKKLDGFFFNRIKKKYDGEDYSNPDNDPRGPYKTSGKVRNDGRPKYTVISPTGVKHTEAWVYSPEIFKKLNDDGQIYWGIDGSSQPRKKSYYKDFIGNVSSNLLMDEYIRTVQSNGKIEKKKNFEVGTTEAGTNELKSILKNNDFDHPKPKALLKYLIGLYPKKEIIVLDFFAGSGTTGQAVMELNAEDGGQRKFILVTNNENGIGEKITRERLYRVINGKGSKGEKIEWTYTAEKPYLSSNNVIVFKIEHTTLTLKDLEKAEKIREIAKAEFKKLNPNCSLNNDFDVYNELAALNPQKGDK